MGIPEIAEPGRLARLTRAPLEWVRALIRGIARALPQAVEDLFRDRCPQYAASISFHVLFSLFPLTIVLAALILQIDSPAWQGAVVSTMGLAVILLSAVVIVGYAGQISIAQFALAGFGAWVAARLIVDTGMPFEVATVLAMLAGVGLGVVFALPAVRVRGVRLAIITFGLATALHRMIFANVPLTGGRTGLEVGERSA